VGFFSYVAGRTNVLFVKNTVSCFLLLCSLLAAVDVRAQVVEQPDPLRPAVPDSVRKAVDSTTKDTIVIVAKPLHLLRYKFTADGTITAGNVNRELLQLASSFDYTLSNYFKLSANPSFVYGKQAGLLAERELFSDLRATYRPERTLYYLTFGSFERSNLRQINRRWTIAGGAGYKLVQSKRAYLSVTNVILQEFTDFYELDDINVVRNSTRLFGEYSFADNRWTVTHTALYQPAIGQYNIRWNATVSVQVKLNAVISLRTTLANAYESLVVPGRQNNDLRFTIGLTYERK